MNGTPYALLLFSLERPWPDHHRFAVAYASCTIALEFPGELVTAAVEACANHRCAHRSCRIHGQTNMPKERMTTLPWWDGSEVLRHRRLDRHANRKDGNPRTKDFRYHLWSDTSTRRL